MKVAHALARLQVESVAGEPVVLSALWQDQPVVLVWLRHFG
jgi:hypothetical protein